MALQIINGQYLEEARVCAHFLELNCYPEKAGHEGGKGVEFCVTHAAVGHHYFPV